MATLATRLFRRQPSTALVSAATKLQMKGTRPRRRRRLAWQERNWEMWEAVPQVRDAFTSHANLVSRVRWVAGVRSDPDQDPIPLGIYLSDPNVQLAVNAALPWMSPTIAATCIDYVRRIRSPIGGQDAIKKELADNLGVAGEGYLASYIDDGSDDPDTAGAEIWEVFSIDELFFEPGPDGGRWRVVQHEGQRDGRLLPPDALVFRVWDPHPRWSNQPTSRLRSALDDLEEFVTLRAGNKAIAQSRIANAGLLVYNKQKFGTVGQNASRRTVPQAKDNPAFAQLTEAMVTAIGNPEDASAVIPVLLGIDPGSDGTVTGMFEHVTFDRPLDEQSARRMADLMLNVAYALPLPIERAAPEGLAGVNHWTGWLVDESGFKTYVEPDVRLQTDAVSEAWIQPAAQVEFGLSEDAAAALVCWYDATPILVRPNRASDVREAFRDSVASPRAYREAIGLGEDDAPTDEELAAYEEFLRSSRSSAPGFGDGAAPASTTETQSPPPAPAAARVAIDPATYDRPTMTAAGDRRARRLARMSATLGQIDRQLFDRLRVAASKAMDDALRVAGARARSAAQGTPHAATFRGVAAPDIIGLARPHLAALNLSPDQLLEGSFTDLADEFDAWVGAAQTRGRRAVLSVDDLPDDDAGPVATRQDEQRALAAAAFVAALVALARTQITSGAPDAPITGEWDTTLSVPAGVVREALAIAGGAKPTATQQGGLAVVTTPGTTEPAPAVGSGPDLDRLIRESLRAELTGWVWIHDAPPVDFPPHADLDGVEFASWDDPALANVDGAWPYVESYAPGDHWGCACTFEKVWGEAPEPEGEPDTEAGD